MSLPLITRKILRWYKRHSRTLPWRSSVDPYAIWVSEVMLQQTRVDFVIPYYERFLSRFPTLKTLADAPLQDVLKVWENMGYYSRARNLHKAARVVADHMGGRLPKTHEEWMQLPGIGKYTASAILSFGFGERFLALDGNGRRVLCRLFAVSRPLGERQTEDRMVRLGVALLPARDSSSFNQALMDLGAMICKPRNPLCENCPLADACIAYRRGAQNRLPLRKSGGPPPLRHMTAGLIRDGRGRLLVSERVPHGLLGGLWKLPGGEMNPGESLEDALARSVLEELGIVVQVGEERVVIQHALTHFRMHLHVFECCKKVGAVRALGCGRWKWAGPRSLKALPFSKADRRVLETLF